MDLYLPENSHINMMSYRNTAAHFIEHSSLKGEQPSLKKGLFFF